MSNSSRNFGAPTGNPNHPAPSAADLKEAVDEFTEGPNIEASPYELQAARGETPLEGPRAESALHWDEFNARYDEWKAATVEFEQAVREMQGGSPGAKAHAQDLARRLARLHHAFVESSQPYFQATRTDD